MSHVPTEREALSAPTLTVPSVEVRPFPLGTSFSPSHPHPILTYPILLTARQRKEYFVPPESFDILPMLKNPMVMMMIFVCITLFILPKAMVSIELRACYEGAYKGMLFSLAKHGSRNGEGDVSTTKPYYEHAEQIAKRRSQRVSIKIRLIWFYVVPRINGGPGSPLASWRMSIERRDRRTNSHLFPRRE